MDKPATENYDKKIHLEQIEFIYRQLPIIIIGPIMGALLTGAMFRNYIDHEKIYTWLTLVIISFLQLFLLWLKYKKTGISENNVRQMSLLYLFVMWITVLCWGSASFFLFSESDLLPQLLLTLFIVISSFFIMVSTLMYAPVIYTIFAVTLPLFVQFVQIGDETHYILSVGLVVMTVMLLFLHHHVSATIEKSLSLQYKNIQLVDNLKIQKEKAEKANLDKSKFLAVASHDLRQPLHAHGLFLGELKERTKKDTPYKKIIAKLELSLTSISNLFNSLLDISKLEAGAITPNIKPFRFEAFIQPIAQEFEAKAKYKGLEFRIVKSTMVINSDKILLERMIRNILENSIRYTTKGKILLGCRHKKSTAIIQILDTGHGIPEAYLESIFSEYYQLEHHQRIKKQGLGLGLAVVKQLCQLLEHSINVTSEIDKGSVFSIEVPVNNQKIIEEPPIIEYTTDNLNDLKIIVIDDENAIRDSMAGILSAWGCVVKTAADADEAESYIDSQFIPDVIISDFQLENNRTGIDAIKQLRAATGTNTHATLITGNTSQMDITEAKLLPYPLLHKPVSPAKLRTLLNFMITEK